MKWRLSFDHGGLNINNSPLIITGNSQKYTLSETSGIFIILIPWLRILHLLFSSRQNFAVLQDWPCLGRLLTFWFFFKFWIFFFRFFLCENKMKLSVIWNETKSDKRGRIYYTLNFKIFKISRLFFKKTYFPSKSEFRSQKTNY